MEAILSNRTQRWDQTPHWGARGYLPFLASFLSFFSFAVSLGLFVFAVRFLFRSLDMDS